MKTMTFGNQTFKINECKSVPEMVNNLLMQIDPDIFNSTEVTRERVRILLEKHLRCPDAKRIDNCWAYCIHYSKTGTITELIDLVEEYINR